MIRAFQWDLARQVERLDWLLAQLPRYADWGYNELYLHLEDAVEYPSLPKVARRDAYSYREMAKLVRAADRVGIKVVPIVNLLGHTQYLIKVPELRDLNELRASDGSPLDRGQICPVHPRTLSIAEKLLRDMAPFCTAGKVHVGLDESFHLGKHPRSQKEIARIGLAAHFARYVQRLNDLTDSVGLRMGMWGDMLYFLPDATRQLPKDIAVYEWYYYAFKRRPRIELFNFIESNLGEQLTRRGLEYWGCPMNGAFRFEPLPHFTDRLENIRSWWRRRHQLNAAGILITSWEPNRLAMELTTVVDAAAASLWLDSDRLEPREMLERGFARAMRKTTVGVARPASIRRRAKAAANVALACDKYPFSGYPRWEINSRWDVISRRESLTSYHAEEKHFRALMRRSQMLPSLQSLQASVGFRWYLAARDLLVRQLQKGIDAKRALQEAHRIGLRAARKMWASTRARRVQGPNEKILLDDLARLHEWQRGGPVFGSGWQLCYRVHNFAPAVQLVAVEQQLSNCTWVPRQACYTIEFQGAAAKPRGPFVREHAAPVTWDGDAHHPPMLRFVARGLGQVKISHAVLYDGRKTIRLRTPRNVLGTACVRSGFPRVDTSENSDTLPVTLVLRS
jgi:hypothetical protein